MPQSSKNKLASRIIIGTVGGSALLGAAFLGGWYFFSLVVLIIMLSLHELHIMGEQLGFSRRDPAGYIFAALIIIDARLYSVSHIVIILILYIAVLLVSLLGKNRAHPLQEMSFKGFSTLYVTLFLTSLLLLRDYPSDGGSYPGGFYTASLFLSVWFLDTSAYFGGKWIGKHPLSPVISPKKTVEGSFFGFAGALLGMIAARVIFFHELPMFHTVMIGTIVGIAGQVGDSIESLIKRKAGVKDSSAFLMGHGGVLDRFDSLIFVSPFVYFYVQLLAPVP